MRHWRLTLLIAVLAVCTTGCLAFAGGFGQSRLVGHLEDTYERTEAAPTGATEVSRAWRSPNDVAATANAIAQAVRPRDEIVAQERTFLAYPDAVVAISASQDGQGSVIGWDPAERGYNRWFAFIGPRWGSYYGPGGTFRGGGSGFGK